MQWHGTVFCSVPAEIYCSWSRSNCRKPQKYYYLLLFVPNLSLISVELFLLTSESFIFDKGISVEEIFQEILT